MDDETSRARRAAVRDVVELRVPVERAVAELARFGWDSEEELHTLTRADALRLLRHYRRGEIPLAEHDEDLDTGPVPAPRATS